MASPAFFASFKIKFSALSLIHARLNKSSEEKPNLKDLLEKGYSSRALV
jgi:hypothetical protein